MIGKLLTIFNYDIHKDRPKKASGHGQDNINFLRKNDIEMNIEKTKPIATLGYPNVAIDFVCRISYYYLLSNL